MSKQQDSQPTARHLRYVYGGDGSVGTSRWAFPEDRLGFAQTPAVSPGYQMEPPVKEHDRVQATGYVESLRIDRPDFAVETQPDIEGGGVGTFLNEDWAHQQVDAMTMVLVRISLKEGSATGVKTFRLLHEDRQGEELAAAMGLLATLKSAFLNRSKVTVYGTATELVLTPNMPLHVSVPSGLFYEVNSVELHRS